MLRAMSAPPSRPLASEPSQRRATSRPGAGGPAACALAAALLCLAAPALARAPWSDFSWRAPPGCPERGEVIRKLEAVLAEHPVALNSADVRGDIQPGASGWVLSLDVQVAGELRERQLVSLDCDDLSSAAAVALVLLLEPSATAVSASPAPAELEPAPALTPEPVAPRREPSADSASSASEPAHDEPTPVALGWTFGADAVLDGATLGQLTAGLGLQTQLAFGAWGIAARALMLPSRRLEVNERDSVEFSHWAGGLRLCRALWSPEPLQLHACAGAELGRVTGEGSGLNRVQRRVHDGWLAGAASAELGWQALPHAGLVARLELLVPVLPRDYVINGDEPAHHTPALTLRAALGVAFDLL